MIYFDKVSKIYQDKDISLSDITLTISPGEFVSIVGHSGAGKSTIVRMIIAEERPSSGKVFFESKDIHSLSSDDMSRHRRRIGTVFQDFKLLPNKTAYENIAFAMEVAGKTDEEIIADVPHVLNLVDMADKGTRFPNQLSGGERQRLAIARAIINQPDVIIADEPTGNLDPVATDEIVQLLKKINELGTTVILTTHNKGVVDGLRKRVITLEQGKIIKDDKSGKYIL